MKAILFISILILICLAAVGVGAILGIIHKAMKEFRRIENEREWEEQIHEHGID